MKPIYEAEFCQIEVTNYCPMSCAYCTRYIRHLRSDQKFNIGLDVFSKILDTLENWPNKIGLIGGEPTVHPRFKEICSILKERFPRGKLALWSSGGKRYRENERLIRETFYHVAYNEHNKAQTRVQLHQPLLVAVQDVTENGKYREDLINECWLQRIWSPSIGPNGGFFCEVACNLDRLLDLGGGYKIERNWWNKKPGDFEDQVDRYCRYCGAPVPLENESIAVRKERISGKLLDEFRRHNLRNLSKEDIEIFDRKLSIEEMEKTKKGKWDPANYHQEMRPDMKEGWRLRQKK